MSSPLLASTRFRLVLAVTRVYSHILLLLASTRTSSPLLGSTRFSPVCYSRLAVTRVYSHLFAITRVHSIQSSLLLASTRILASRIYSHTRIYWYWWGRKLPYMCFSLLPDLVRSWLLLASTHTSCCYSRLLAGLRHYSRVLDLVRSLLLLASTRILASTGIGEDARCRSCVFPCYSHTLVLASTRFRPVCYSRLLAYSRLASTRILHLLIVIVADGHTASNTPDLF